MHLDRLAHYIAGGRPPGAARSYPGCRDRRPPVASVPVELRGALYFATRSPVWRGGRAFYDPEAEGRVLARAHLVSAEQFTDIAAQEMYREPGGELDLGEAVRAGRSVLGAGRYETLICPGSLDGRPVLTFTAPWRMHEVAPTAPSAAYLRHLAQGLLEAGAWDVDTVTAYLAACPGTAGLWTERAVAELLRDDTDRPNGASA
ncbi:histone deacetylase [Streptomyces sp. NBC_00083]|uniref:histone deacetylase n=1 Tax=Streptomyces sp. NBC_00083 TaxID=2975647 RepID=UPI00225037E4|nr:histone deacetylase [Streptomyces sp. NBC_00083]MCX5386599.1 histone deacetylase [Streptomyces sp. NBC_00083]